MEMHDTPKEQGRRHRRTLSRMLPGALTLLWGLLVACGICLSSIGTTYGRYMTTGRASVGFLPAAKPTVTVSSTEEKQANPQSQTFQVTCSQASAGTGIRVRLYASPPSEAPTLTATYSTDNTAYTLVARSLDANTAAGKEATWVYIFTDDTGKEVLFPASGEALGFTVQSESDISGLTIRAEAVKK